MRPVEITYEKVRAAMEKIATWPHGTDALAYGHPVYAEDVVFVVHGYDGSLLGPAQRASRDAAREAMVFDGYKPTACPVTSQVQAVRKHLATLVAEGLVERQERGNGVRFLWLTDVVRKGREDLIVQKANADTLQDQLHAALSAAIGSFAEVSVSTVERLRERGAFDVRTMLVLDEEQTIKLRDVLREVYHFRGGK